MPATTATFTHAPVLTPANQPMQLGGKPITELCSLFFLYKNQLDGLKTEYIQSGCYCPGCELSYKSAKAALETRLKELHKVLYPIFVIETSLAGQPVERREASAVKTQAA
jgi:hypothetical protein